VKNGGALSPSGHGTTTRSRSPGAAGLAGQRALDYNISNKWRAFVRASNYGRTTRPQQRSQPVPVGPGRRHRLRARRRNWAERSTGSEAPRSSASSPSATRRGPKSSTTRSVAGRQQKSKIGVTLPQRFPAQNPLDVIPRWTSAPRTSAQPATVRWEGRFRCRTSPTPGRPAPT